MLKEGQLIDAKISSALLNYYRNLGYKCNIGDNIKVLPKDLPKESHKKVIAVCDECGKEQTLEYRYYNNNIKRNNGKFICKYCYYNNSENYVEARKKMKETCLKKYSVDNPSKLPEIQNKIKETNLERYGVEYTCLSEEIKNKIRKTFQEKYGVNTALENKEFLKKSRNTLMKNYGVDNPQKSKEIREKLEETNLKKYGFKTSLLNSEIKEKAKKTTFENWGVEYSLSSLEVREKGKKTMLEKYGVENAGQSKELQAKMRKTLFQHGKVRTSKQQKNIFDILNKKYNCILNYPVDIFSLDCAIFINDNIKIDVEYDGWYWHNKVLNKEKDAIRDNKILEKGFKILRIKGGITIPAEKELIEKINMLISTDSKYEEIILKEWSDNINNT